MLAKKALGRFAWAGLLGVSLGCTGCVETPGAEHIVGPDDTQMLHVHCGDEQVVCFQLAGERCPNGYDLSPIFDPHDGNFLVRCRDARAFASATSPGTNGAHRAAPSTAGDTAGWPPTEVARPTEPWPAARNGNESAPPDASGTVDIGY